MREKSEIPAELKLRAVREYLNNEGSQYSIASKYGICRNSFKKWLIKYKALGESAFKQHKNLYTAKFKIQVVSAYLSGEGSCSDLAIRFKILSPETVRSWVLKYNSHEKLKDSEMRGTQNMTKGRKTTFDERVEIVKYCIEHQNNYTDTARKYNISYQQIYAWVRKYEKDDIDALRDRRGKRKELDQMTELEKLRAQNRLLQAQNKRQQIEIDFLKKLEEIERRRF